MGSSKKTYRAYQTVSIMDNNNKRTYFSDTLLAAWFVNGKADPVIMTKALINGARKYTNAERNKKLGIAADININYQEVSIDNLLNYMQTRHPDLNVNKIIHHETLNIDGAWIFIKDWIYNNPDMHIYQDGAETSMGTIYAYEKTEYKYEVSVPSLTIGSETVVRYPISYTIKDDGSYSVRFVTDRTANEGNVPFDSVWLTTPVDNNIYTFVVYADVSEQYAKFGNTYTINNVWTDVIPTGSIMKEAWNTSAFIFPIKENNVIVGDDGKRKKVYYEMGLKESDFETEMVENQDVKDVMIAFSTAYYPGNTYSSLVSKYYGFEGIPKEAVITIGSIEIKYYWNKKGKFVASYKSKSKANAGEEEILNLQKDENGLIINKFVIIPQDVIDKLPIREKYDLIDWCMNIYYYSEVTVKKSFFQSMFFQIVLSVALSVATANPAVGIASFAAGRVIGEIAKSNPELALVLTVALIIATGNPEGGITLTADKIIQITNAISKYYFMEQSLNIQDDYYELNEEKKAYEEEYAEDIKAMKNKTYFTPMESISVYYDFIYTAQYNYDQFYDYDKMFKLDEKVMI